MKCKQFQWHRKFIIFAVYIIFLFPGFQYSSSSTVKLTAEAKLAGVFETELNIFRSALKHSGPVEVKEMHLRDFVTQQQIELVLVSDLLHTNRIQQQVYYNTFNCACDALINYCFSPPRLYAFVLFYLLFVEILLYFPNIHSYLNELVQ